MRVGIFSDVHANLEALEIVLKALEYEGVDKTICPGDLVGYGPDPNQCIEKVMEAADKVVAGNHDYAACGMLSTEYFNEYARMAIEWTSRVIDTKFTYTLSNLPLTIIEDGITMVHATPEAPNGWHYILDIADARRSFRALKNSLCFVGHSHIPVAFVQDESGKISIRNPSELNIKMDEKYIINVGSVGQPRDGDPRTTYGILDTDKKKFWLKRLPYPVEEVQKKMREENLPPYLINRLSVGQ